MDATTLYLVTSSYVKVIVWRRERNEELLHTLKKRKNFRLPFIFFSVRQDLF